MQKQLLDFILGLRHSLCHPHKPVYFDPELGAFERHPTGAWNCSATRGESSILVTIVCPAKERPDEELLVLARRVLSGPRFADVCRRAVAYVNEQCPSDLCGDAGELRIDQLYIDDKVFFSLLFAFAKGANYRIRVRFRDEVPVCVGPSD